MLISIHIPKTGGTSFRTLLEEHFKDKLLLDYTDRPMKNGNLVRNISALGGIFKTKRTEKYDCIHGHFLPIKYRSLKDKSLAIWLRDPVERALSRYYHWKRHFSQNDFQFKKYIKDPNISLEKFCGIKHYQNLYSKYLWGMKLTDFQFIGITENYENSINIFKRMYNIENSTNLTTVNVNPEKHSVKYDIDDKLRNLIIKQNLDDYKIYEQALIVNKYLENKYIIGNSCPK
ncbi:sulfotransferase family 2 domain-containing protein [Candidatus Halobeggiatoa sp. HSG11]|nr:sulfotransferase family 2 domain-containing protein [Candidatus Halobeggiatoa sp. HSG11]